MIQEAGFGVAMGGSTPEVTQIADYVTTSNKEEGVAKVLEEFCYKNITNILTFGNKD